jgi:predicted RNase H-like nuclease (RuvC/YqgF family)
MKFPEEQYKKWCKETKRNGGILIGNSIREFFEYLSESIEPCATSSENYWKQRCEAAELNIATYSDWNTDRLDVDRMPEESHNLFMKWHEALREWQRLKSIPEPTPSPTGDRDCEELKKEVERLKDVEIELEKKTKSSKEWCDKAMEAARHRQELQSRISELEEGLGKAISNIEMLYEHIGSDGNIEKDNDYNELKQLLNL